MQPHPSVVGRYDAAPTRGATMVLQTTAMACEFAFVLNPTGSDDQLETASLVLDRVHELESQLTVYRDTSELLELNRRAAVDWCAVEPQLYGLLKRAVALRDLTEGAFSPTAGPLIAIWRQARHEHRIPTEAELAEACAQVRNAGIEFRDADCCIRLTSPGAEFNLGAMGKGYAVDRMAEEAVGRGVHDLLLHGGHSSVVARGVHAGHRGWPVGVRHPLFPEQHLCTYLLQNEALGTSGTAVQWFRHRGKRYGHILDPRTGMPVDGVLSVSVIAPNAALADALATALFVLGPDRAVECCQRLTNVGFLMFPPPRENRRLEPLVYGIDPDRLFW